LEDFKFVNVEEADKIVDWRNAKIIKLF
jgi:hypothetical protein